MWRAWCVCTVLEPEDLTFRPILASTNCPTNRLSSLVDKILSPYIIYVKAYVKDTSDILKKLPKQLSEDEMSMTMDIKSQYTNMSINLGLSAIKYWTEKYPQISKFQSELILEACNIVLSNNSFIFMPGCHSGLECWLSVVCWLMHCRFAPNQGRITLCCLYVAVCGS